MNKKEGFPADIIEKIDSDFETEAQCEEILKSLVELTDELEIPFGRIPRCVLYVANGNTEAFNRMLTLARTDWRDAIMQAEYDSEKGRIFDFEKTFPENGIH
ncbi:hypothetical protein [Gilvibacter sediminis]|uniref:hypothetical protein n=1 Tax=Gilvibacter sediminis TaxID=379071 RepID=UPI00235009FC|nr:hypothetical protein [Gilvibacter sediminis]MDC7997707.1 hypothetical protein [Gilvibacter sediminis]